MKMLIRNQKIQIHVNFLDNNSISQRGGTATGALIARRHEHDEDVAVTGPRQLCAKN
jgi:hypothetical protein